MKTTMPTVYVSIPSYKDPQVVHTVRDCCEKSSGDQTIVICVCEYNDRETSVDSIHDLPPHVTLLIDKLPAYEAQGPCYARVRIETMILSHYERSESYSPLVLMIDAHTLFARNWDRILVEEFSHLPPNSVMSHYPKSYIRSPRGPVWNPDKRRAIMDIRRKNEHGIYLFFYSLSDAKGPLLSKGLAAGCLAFRIPVLYEVPYIRDVPYLFLGEEMVMWYRLYRAGYDVYTPSYDIVQTTFVRQGRANFSNQSKYDARKLDLQLKSIALIQEHMGLARTVRHEPNADWRDSFQTQNRLLIKIRSSESFHEMLEKMYKHKGPLSANEWY